MSLIFWIGLLGTGHAAEIEYQLERLSGQAESLSRFEIRQASVIIPGPPVRQAPLDQVVSLRRKDSSTDWSERTTIVWLSNGDRLVGEPTDMDEDALTLRWRQFPGSEPVTIPLEYVSAMCLATPTSAAARQKLFRALTTSAEQGDVAWLTSGDRVSGELLSLDDGEYFFRTETGKLPILREKLQAIRFDPDLAAPIKPPHTRYLISFSDGSRLTVRDVATTGEQLSFTTIFGVKSSLPATALDSLQVFSPGIQSLAERKPDSVEFTPFLGRRWTWAKDRNVLSGPLQLRRREFPTGLGMHSRTQMTFPIEPNDRELRATVGIDDAAEGKGHAVFTVAVDDKVVWTSPGVTGTSEPLAIPPVNIRGGKRLTLTVDFGEEGDVGDYADWCDAIILRDE